MLYTEKKVATPEHGQSLSDRQSVKGVDQQYHPVMLLGIEVLELTPGRLVSLGVGHVTQLAVGHPRQWITLSSTSDHI